MNVKKETKRKRFLKLIKKFSELPEERFDIRSWIDSGKGPVELPSSFLTKNHCGTTGCVAGWTVAWFPRSWKYNDVGSPLLKSLGRDRVPVTLCMSEFFGGSEHDWACVIFHSHYRWEVKGEDKEVPKHLVMERLTKLYNKLYKK